MNIDKIARKIESHYASHGAAIKLKLGEVIGDGERLIFDVKIKKGTKASLVFDRASDIRTALGLQLFQPFKEGLDILLAVSEKPVTENRLSKMLASPDFQRSEMRIPLALGYDMRGAMHFADLVKFPHAMYGGSTNCGKTIGLRCLITSIVFKQSVNRVNLMIVDTGASGLDIFNSLPHLSHPIVKDEETAVRVMQSLTNEMERRVALPIEELRLLPAVVCVVDEYLSLIKNIKATEKLVLTSALSSLLRRGRHAKFHLVLATQEPSKESMQINLNNVNARMAFTCSNVYSSIALVGVGGAEKLPGKGAILFKSPEHPEPIYLQGAAISTEDIERLISRINSTPHDFSNKFAIPELEPLQFPLETGDLNKKTSNLESNQEMVSIILWTLGRENVAAKSIMERFHMGNRAGGVLDELFKMNLIGDKNANQPRKVIPLCIEEIPAEVMEFLLNNGVSVEDIADAIRNRS